MSFSILRSSNMRAVGISSGPHPADLFRTMEDASGVDLDWFWRGWFYTTDHVDISLERVRLFTLDTM